MIGAALVTSWVLFSAPEKPRETPKFEVKLPETVLEQIDPSFIPVVEPPIEEEPEVIPAVVVESPPQRELEELPEPVEYPAQRPWMPRHLRNRPVMKPEPRAELPKPAPAVVPVQPTPPVSVVMSPTIDNAKCPPPEYPRRAQRLRWHGATMLLVDVDVNGNPVKITIRTSSGYEILDNAAIKAVEQWHFHPQKRNGVAEAGQLLVPIRFEAPN